MCHLLFMIYTRKLFEVVKEYLPQAHTYANDIQLYLSFKAVSISSQNDAVSAISCWMIKDKLCLNDSKMEFIIIGTRQQLVKVNIDSFCVGDTSIAPVSSVKNLGSWFDEHMTMVTHITKLRKAASLYLYCATKAVTYFVVRVPFQPYLELHTYALMRTYIAQVGHA